MRIGAALLLCAILFASTTGADQPTVTIKLSGEADAGKAQTIEAVGLSAVQLAELRKFKPQPDVFSVYVLTEEGAPSSTPLFGTWQVAEDRVTFEPRYPLVPGVSYLARLSLDRSPDGRTSYTVEASLRVPPLPPRPRGHITHVFPSSAVLPENALKFYVHFSVPMSRGEAYNRIRLLRANGEQVDRPFLQLDEELWNYRGTRFTLFFDPGRVKRGLKPRELFGPALEEGASYVLVIDRGWADDRGQALEKGFRKEFRVVAPDYRQPDPMKWRWQVPQANSTDPLVITFSEPLDEAMLHRVLVVLDKDDRVVRGNVTVGKAETVWSFQPRDAWQADDYSLHVDTTLEDRAGNSISRPFEVDIFHKVERQITPKLIKLAFKVK